MRHVGSREPTSGQSTAMARKKRSQKNEERLERPSLADGLARSEELWEQKLGERCTGRAFSAHCAFIENEVAIPMDLLDEMTSQELALCGQVIAMSSAKYTQALEDQFWRTVRHWREKKPEAWQPRPDPLAKKAVLGSDGSSMARYANFSDPSKDQIADAVQHKKPSGVDCTGWRSSICPPLVPPADQQSSCAAPRNPLDRRATIDQ